MEPLSAAYRYNLQGMIDRFGLERVAKQYGFTLNAGKICDDRIMKKNFCFLLMEDMNAESPLSRFFVDFVACNIFYLRLYTLEIASWLESQLEG